MSTHAVSPTTQEALRSLDTISSQGLSRREDVGILLDLAFGSGRDDILDRLSFEAKFVSQSVHTLDRLDAAQHGVERLKKELSASLDRAGALLRQLVHPLEDTERVRIEDEYLALRPDAIHNLITLCHDLRWYKNLQIDRSRDAQSRQRTRRPR